MEDIEYRIDLMLRNKQYVMRVKKSKKNWLDIPEEEVIERLLMFFQELKPGT